MLVYPLVKVWRIVEWFPNQVTLFIAIFFFTLSPVSPSEQGIIDSLWIVTAEGVKQVWFLARHCLLVSLVLFRLNSQVELEVVLCSHIDILIERYSTHHLLFLFFTLLIPDL